MDAKSGVSGAGRSAKQNLLYTEIAEGINCYGVGSHRHMPEIEQVPCWPPLVSFPCDAMVQWGVWRGPLLSKLSCREILRRG